jgi:hypothetical protein
MKRSYVLALGVALVLSAGCRKEAPAEAPAEAPQASEPAPAAPAAQAAPATPCPVTAEFVRLEGEGEAAHPVLRFSSTAEQPVSRLMLVLAYVAADGRALGRHPWTQSGPVVVPAAGQVELTLGAGLPPETARVEAQIQGLTFADGQVWRSGEVRAVKPNKGRRPASFQLHNVDRLRPTTRAEAAVRVAPHALPVRAGEAGAAPTPTPAPTTPPITR